MRLFGLSSGTQPKWGSGPRMLDHREQQQLGIHGQRASSGSDYV